MIGGKMSVMLNLHSYSQVTIQILNYWQNVLHKNFYVLCVGSYEYLGDFQKRIACHLKFWDLLMHWQTWIEIPTRPWKLRHANIWQEGYPTGSLIKLFVWEIIECTKTSSKNLCRWRCLNLTQNLLIGGWKIGKVFT